jgi:uncharacterized lipoprotein
MKTVLIILFISLFFSACALSPQVISINPELTVTENTTTNSSASLNLLVTDKRQSSTLGHRGGVYKDTAVIKTEGDITTKIHQNLSNAFNKAGYKVEQSSTTLLEVSIIELTYQGHGENRVGEIDVSAKILATVNNSETKVTKSYKASRKKEVLKAPSDEKNEEMINEILGDVIQRVLDDEELLAYIKSN